MDLQLKGKTALVSRSSEGIGKGIAMMLAKEGVDVAICARRMEPLQKTADEISYATGRKIIPITAELTKDADAEGFIEQAHKALGCIDIMINNAGSAPGQNLTLSLGCQYGRHNISFCAVNPGPVRTERWAGLVNAMARDMKISNEEADKLAPASIPLGRIAEVEEVANLVVMLASPLVQMANGTMIEIDGGQR
jgi:NAD(P)-dependent dehydrogenase (short-subunit alcohol dehydrogenase family)